MNVGALKILILLVALKCLVGIESRRVVKPDRGVSTIEPPIKIEELVFEPTKFSSDLNYEYWDFGGAAYADLRQSKFIFEYYKDKSPGWLWSRKAVADKSFTLIFKYSIEKSFRTPSHNNSLLGLGFFASDKSLRDRATPLTKKTEMSGAAVLFTIPSQKSNFHSIGRLHQSVALYTSETPFTLNPEIKKNPSPKDVCASDMFSHGKYIVIINYDDEKKEFKLLLGRANSANSWNKCINAKNVVLPKTKYIGFTTQGSSPGQSFIRIHNISAVKKFPFDSFPTPATLDIDSNGYL